MLTCTLYDCDHLYKLRGGAEENNIIESAEPNWPALCHCMLRTQLVGHGVSPLMMKEEVMRCSFDIPSLSRELSLSYLCAGDPWFSIKGLSSILHLLLRCDVLKIL